jgi:hypothetical protein
MDVLPRQKLCEIVVTYGESVAEEPRRCEALLRDLCGAYRREISVLTSAARERVPSELLAGQRSIPAAILLPRLSRRLQDDLGLAEEAASWAVESWALALRVLPQPLLKPVDQRPGSPAVDTTSRKSSQRQSAASLIPSTRIVSKRAAGAYRTISAAISDAPSGTRILVRPGRYEDHLLLDRPIEIIGDSPREKIVVESLDADCLHVAAETALVRGLTLSCRHSPGTNAECVTVRVSAGSCTLEDCDITSDSNACVAVFGPRSAPIIRRCVIHDGAAGGLYFDIGADGTVEDCEIFGHDSDAISISMTSNPIFRRCRIHDSAGHGVHISNYGAGALDCCEIFGHDVNGIAVNAYGAPEVTRCKIFESGEFGVHIRDLYLLTCWVRGWRGRTEGLSVVRVRPAA